MRSRADRSLPLRRFLLEGIVARPNIVYNIVCNIIIVTIDITSARGNMAGKPLKQAKASAARSRQIAPAREIAAAVLIARGIEEDIVLGRRLPRERLIEPDLCARFHTLPA